PRARDGGVGLVAAAAGRGVPPPRRHAPRARSRGPRGVGCVKLAAFDFDLPPDLIAQHPVSPRDAARMLEIAPDGIADRGVRDLPVRLRVGDVLVYNDTRVIKARLVGKRGAGLVEVTRHQMVEPAAWRPFARA